MQEGKSMLQASIDRASSALERRWAKEKEEVGNLYLIDIPAQSIKVQGDMEAKSILSLLKSIHIHGTYRITKGTK